MIRKYEFHPSKSHFETSFTQINEMRFSPKYKAIGGAAPMPEEEIIIYDGGSIEGWEEENGAQI